MTCLSFRRVEKEPLRQVQSSFTLQQFVSLRSTCPLVPQYDAMCRLTQVREVRKENFGFPLNYQATV